VGESANSPQADNSDPLATSTEKTGIRVIRKGASAIQLDHNGQSSWVRKNESVPSPPFYGTKIVEGNLNDLFEYLDDFALMRSRWGFQKGSQNEEDFQRILETKAIPLFKSLKEQVLKSGILFPRAVYGYYPAASRGNKVLVYSEKTTAATPAKERDVIAEFEFPRQTDARKLCISDFFRHEDSAEIDVLGVQVVTLGIEASHHGAELYRQEKFSDYYYFHGLTTELTEGFAEWLHARIRKELGIHSRDATLKRQLFSQGYQGSRYSFGYPACPEMELNEPLLKLLDAKRIGIELSESYQMVPELSTSALVSWHPQARYFST
jgi:5-methyltetrahydrofolate--homocysteine methyltransferase